MRIAASRASNSAVCGSIAGMILRHQLEQVAGSIFGTRHDVHAGLQEKKDRRAWLGGRNHRFIAGLDQPSPGKAHALEEALEPPFGGDPRRRRVYLPETLQAALLVLGR